jgi:hypothetical protein
MQNSLQSKHVPRRVAVFPAKAAGSRTSSPDARTQFEHLLIFVLFTLWAVGVVAWTLLSAIGFSHGTGSLGFEANPFSSPTVMPTLQSATVFAVRLMFGW